MLQIVIWMLCIYLIIKGVELVLVARNAPEGRYTASAIIALLFCGIAWLAAIGFFVLSIEQANQMPGQPFIGGDSYSSTGAADSILEEAEAQADALEKQATK